MSTYAEELRAVAESLTAAIASESRDRVFAAAKRLVEAADIAALAWSGSNIGYHSCVYYAKLETPPPGAHFSPEWGIGSMFAGDGTTGAWLEYPRPQLRNTLLGLADNPDLEALHVLANAVRLGVEEARETVASILSAFLAFTEDSYLEGLKGALADLDMPSIGEVRTAFTDSVGTIWSRDSLAMSQGIQIAPHQELGIEAEVLQAPFLTAQELVRLASRASAHIERLSQRPDLASPRQHGTRIFIGHGRSPLWRELKDFVSERLNLPYDEFNRVPIAGTTNVDRLSEMLDNAAVAFLVLTAEDEQADGTVTARQNVVHEAGLFQGRLGFARAIVMLEEGCDQFSNIDGLGQLRFPAGNISAKFEDVRRVLERENLLD